MTARSGRRRERERKKAELHKSQIGAERDTNNQWGQKESQEMIHPKYEFKH